MHRNTKELLQEMLQELSDESRRMGIKMNIAKTKVMVVDNTPINVNNVLIENVESYVYLGQRYNIKEKNQDKNIQRRFVAGWAAYGKHRDIFKSKFLPGETCVQFLCAASYDIMVQRPGH